MTESRDSNLFSVDEILQIQSVDFYFMEMCFYIEVRLDLSTNKALLLSQRSPSAQYLVETLQGRRQRGAGGSRPPHFFARQIFFHRKTVSRNLVIIRSLLTGYVLC